MRSKSVSRPSNGTHGRISATGLLGTAVPALSHNRSRQGWRVRLQLRQDPSRYAGGGDPRRIAQPADGPERFKAFCEEFHREVNRLRIVIGDQLDDPTNTALDVIEVGGLGIGWSVFVDAPVRALKEELVMLEARRLTLQHELAATDAPASRRGLSATGRATAPIRCRTR
jgi:hypothetical protein